MEKVEGRRRSGSTQTVAVTVALLLALFLFLPGAWYARYHDQLAAPAAGLTRPGAAPSSRPSGVVSLPPPGPGQTRTVQIQHTGGQVVTTISDGHMTMTMRGADPRPPSSPLDALGQTLCDRYNAWKCARGDPRQPANVLQVSGRVSVSFHITPNPRSPAGTMIALPAINIRSSPPAHAPGTRAPG